MTLKGKGTFLIVDIEQQQEQHGRIQVIGTEQHFAKGRVVANGPYVIVEVGAEVIVALVRAVPLGLGYPDSYRVVDGEKDLVAVLVEEEASENEDSPGT